MKNVNYWKENPNIICYFVEADGKYLIKRGERWSYHHNLLILRKHK